MLNIECQVDMLSLFDTLEMTSRSLTCILLARSRQSLSPFHLETQCLL